MLKLLRRMFAFRGLVETYPVMITSGAEHRIDAASNTYYVPKRDLVAAIMRVMQEERWAFAAALRHGHTLVHELQQFIVKPTPSGNEQFAARDGEHDDIVLSVALAMWVGEVAYAF